MQVKHKFRRYVSELREKNRIDKSAANIKIVGH